MTKAIKVLKSEFRLIRRDSMLFMMPFFVIYMGVVLHFLMPWLNTYLAANGMMPGSVSANGFSYYYPLVMYYMVIITGPQISGMVYAVLILSDKDDHTIQALMVSPLTAKIYINRKLALSFVTGAIFILALFYMIGIDLMPFWIMVLISIGGGFTSSVISLALAIFAKNKVQGMNYAKGVSFVAMVILASFFVNGKQQLIFGLLPPYWVCKSYTLALDGDPLWILFLIIGIVYQGGLTYYLSKVFQKKIYD